jgi:hypothetical protein
MKPWSIRLTGACKPWIAAALLATVAAAAQEVVYEFPSCQRGSKDIQVLAVPSSYGVSGDRRINERVPPADPGRVTFFRTYLFATYPDFEPLATASAEQKNQTQQALGDAAIPGAWVIHGDGNSFYRARDTAPPEESPDGRYWVFPDRAFRAGRPSGDAMNHFVPKDRGDVLIMCADRGDNSLPTSGARCIVQSLVAQPPQLACITVGYRIPPEDLTRWRELDARLQSKVKSMTRQRGQ